MTLKSSWASSASSTKKETGISSSKNFKATRNRTLSDGSKVQFGEVFIRNEVKVLLTRGIKGLFIYACDPALRKALKEIAMI